MTAVDTYESPLSTRYASNEMKGLFSPHTKYKVWRKLWVALAEAEKELGIDITKAQIEELKAHINTIDFTEVRRYEKELRHEVMAHIHAYGDQCPQAKGIIHLGATSSYVMDNGDLIQEQNALKLIKGKLVLLIEKLNHISLKQAATPCMGYTHLQPAQATTVGKRCALWLQDFLFDFKDLEALLNSFPFLGVKGAIGSQTSFLALFEGDEQKVIDLDQKVTEKMGFSHSFTIASQTFPRKQELRLLSVLAGIAASAHKCATDLRLLSHLSEVEEPFGQEQVGSSAMPYKRNPIFSERICGLARFVTSLWNNASSNASLQWLERSLDDSSNRRMTIPEACLAIDSILNLLCTLIEGLKLFPKMMEANLKEHLPYVAMELLMAGAVLKGKDRQTVHERLRLLCFEASKKRKETGSAPDLLKQIAEDKEIGLSTQEIDTLLKDQNLIGRSKEQVIDFLKLEVEPVLEKHLTQNTTIPAIEV